MEEINALFMFRRMSSHSNFHVDAILGFRIGMCWPANRNMSMVFKSTRHVKHYTRANSETVVVDLFIVPASHM